MAVPTAPPKTTPVDVPIVITPLLLLHVPPAEKSLRLVVSPTQTVLVPVIAAGNGLTVTSFVAKQPVDVNI